MTSWYQPRGGSRGTAAASAVAGNGDTRGARRVCAVGCGANTRSSLHGAPVPPWRWSQKGQNGDKEIPGPKIIEDPNGFGKILIGNSSIIWIIWPCIHFSWVSIWVFRCFQGVQGSCLIELFRFVLLLVSELRSSSIIHGKHWEELEQSWTKERITSAIELENTLPPRPKPSKPLPPGDSV